MLDKIGKGISVNIITRRSFHQGNRETKTIRARQSESPTNQEATVQRDNE
jgi:hypothetical protein